MNNPWTNISWSNTIADCDKNHKVVIGLGKCKKEVLFGSSEYVDFINGNKKYKNGTDSKNSVKLSFDCLPEPFFGDPESNVYCLCMNPGEPDCDFNEIHDKNGGLFYEAYCQAMLKHQLQQNDLLFDGNSIIRDAAKYANIMKNILGNLKDFKKAPKHFCPRPHAGDVWQREIWKQLIDKLGRNPKIFSIEFFPYHSKSGFKFPEYLPSNEYRNYLIKQAMDAKKLIIIMRMRDEWYKIEENDSINGLGPRLKRYENKVFLRNSQRVWLSPGNFCWEIPEIQNQTKSLSIPYAEPWACHSLKDIINMF